MADEEANVKVQEVIELQSSDEYGDEQQDKVSGDGASYQFQTMWTVRIHNSLIIFTSILALTTFNPVLLFLSYFMHSVTFARPKNSSPMMPQFSDHLIYCKCTKPDVRNKLKECNLLTLGFSPLTKYCELIAKLYGLEDSTKNDTQAVVWGDCPSIPSGYVDNPQNIDIDFALRVNTVGDVVSKEYVSVSGSILTEKAK
jgi:hypothetical protein